MSAPVTPETLAQFTQRNGDSWRLRRDPDGNLQLDAISGRSPEGGSAWAYCGTIVDERIDSDPTWWNAQYALLDAMTLFVHGIEAMRSQRAARDIANVSRTVRP